MRFAAILVAMLVAAGCAHAQPSGEQAPGEMDRSGFVDAALIVPGLVVDMRYFGEENFVGRRVAGYEAPVCLLTREAAMALAAVQMRLSDFGLGLKIYDCYRPKRAVADFVAWAKDISDTKRKSAQYPNVDKSKLFELGYIAERSGHSRGSTLDITLVDLRTGAELDMGSGYDLFDTLSWSDDPRPSLQARTNRLALQAAMAAEGFRRLREEWWHFTLMKEPFPDTYFDFPVSR